MKLYSSFLGCQVVPGFVVGIATEFKGHPNGQMYFFHKMLLDGWIYFFQVEKRYDKVENCFLADLGSNSQMLEAMGKTQRFNCVKLCLGYNYNKEHCTDIKYDSYKIFDKFY